MVKLPSCCFATKTCKLTPRMLVVYSERKATAEMFTFIARSKRMLWLRRRRLLPAARHCWTKTRSVLRRPRAASHAAVAARNLPLNIGNNAASVVCYVTPTEFVECAKFYHPLSTVSGRFWDQYGNPIFFSYLPSTSHTNLTRISLFFVRKRVMKIKPNSPRYC